MLQVRGTPLRTWAAGAKTGADYVQGLWKRLNGSAQQSMMEGLLNKQGPLKDLPWPRADPEARAGAITSLSHSIDSLEKRLQEASKVGSSHSQHRPGQTVGVRQGSGTTLRDSIAVQD